jgi:hypothetical protein
MPEMCKLHSLLYRIFSCKDTITVTNKWTYYTTTLNQNKNNTLITFLQPQIKALLVIKSSRAFSHVNVELKNLRFRRLALFPYQGPCEE